MCQNELNLPKNVDLTVQQYKNTVRLKGLIAGIMEIMQDKLGNATCKYQDQMNIDEAEGYWLDRIGGIFGYPRPLIDAGEFVYFGFDGNGVGFDQGTFVPDDGDEAFVPAGDGLYRILLKAWINGLFTDGSLPSINKTIQTALGPNGGHVIDNGDMSADVALHNIDINVLLTIARTGVIPKPAAVKYTYYLSTDSVFGFDGNGVGFDQAPFVTVI